MKIGIICGHGAGDPGATSKTFGTEADMVRKLAPYFQAHLSKYADATILDTSINYYEYLKNHWVNFKGYDLVVELHANAGAKDPQGNGVTTGIEIWVTTSEDKTLTEEAMCRNVSALGLKNRGVKRCNFFVINQIKSQGVSCCLVENGFIDDKDDMELIFNNMDKYAQALAQGIVETYGLTATNTPAQPQTPSQGQGNTSTGAKYKVGQKVRFSSCFRTAADASTRNANLTVKNMSVWEGTISRILTVNGVTVYDLSGICFVNNGDIREVISSSSSSSNAGSGTVLNSIPSDFIRENATFTCTVSEGIHILEAPSLNGKRTGLLYEKGENVIYDGYVRREGYVWISWISASTGKRRWMAAGELNAQGVNVVPYGTFK